MLEVSRTSAYAMGEASTTGTYAHSTAPVEDVVVDWFAAMRESVDRVIAGPLAGPRPSAYAAGTSRGMQPLLDADELAGVVGALAVDRGTGLRPRDPGAAYERLVESELAETRRSAAVAGQTGADVARLGFLDQAASAALIAVARRQDATDLAAWRGLAETKGVVMALQREKAAGLSTVAAAYASDGTMRTALDDLVIAVVRSDVELSQTERDEARRATLAQRIGAIPGVGSSTWVGSSLALGAGRAPALPTSESLRAARAAEIRAAWDAVGDDRAQRFVADTGQGGRHGTAPGGHPDRLAVAEGRNGRIPAIDRLPRGKNSTVKLVESDAELRRLFADLTHGARRLDNGSYPGERYLRPDGVEVRLRHSSTSGGATIDLEFIDGTGKRVHIR
jgi:hypothetical protein